MALSYELISQFAKLVNQDKKTNAETTVYGEIVVDGEKKYVQLDGSDQLIPIEDGSTSANANVGERVSVLIKNHTATVNGNVSSPAARTGDVKNLETKVDSFDIVIAEQIQASEAYIKSLLADEATIGELEAAKATIAELIAKDAEIGELIAKKATITDLIATKIDAAIVEATYATIKNLDATNATVAQLDVNKASVKDLDAVEADIVKLNADKASVKDLEAAEADITKLNADKASVTDLNAANAKIGNLEAEDAKINGTLSAHNAVIANLNSAYASIDFANINMAAVEKLFAESGIIKNLVVGDTSITGELVGVTLSADLIKANTLKAEQIVVRGSDGNYYKLNTNFDNIEGVTPVEEDAIHGSAIVAKSITAEKVSVHDLVAFGATIGGFNITDSAIFSGAKGSVDADAIEGVYLDSSGQFAIGNMTSFIKYYKDASGARKLAISADEITFGTGRKSVEEAIDEVAESTRANTEDLTDYISATTKELENLQGQIDGSITTWFYEYVPTKNNIPASEWTTTDLKNNHLGDLFYDTLTGYCYRWQVLNNEYFWTLVKDTDVTTALENAATAQSTADNKRRVFVSTPVPPYDIGDLWTQGSSGDLMRCQTAKTADQTYVAADWVKASKYTDDTAANQAQATANALNTRVTNAETQIIQNKENIELQAKKTTELDNKFAGYYTKTEADSKIKQSADAITLSVEEKISAVEIGGRNLLLNSSMKENLDEWEEVGNILDLRKTVSGGQSVRADDISSKEHTVTVLAKSKNLSDFGDNLLGDYSLDDYFGGDETLCNLVARDEPYVVSRVVHRSESEDYSIYFEDDHHIQEIYYEDLVSVPEVGDKFKCVDNGGSLYLYIINTTEIMVSGVNLFNIEATEVVLQSSWSGNTVARQLKENAWYIGLTYNNYFYSNSANVTYSLNDDSVTVTSFVGGYGITQALRCVPNQMYYLYFEADKRDSIYVSVGYYDKDGNYLQSSYASVSGIAFTTPNNCNWITCCLTTTYKTTVTFSKVQVSLVPSDEFETYKVPTYYTAALGEEIEVEPYIPTTVVSNPSANLELTYRPISGFIEKNGKQCLDIKHLTLGETKSVRQNVLSRIDRDSKCMFSGWFMIENLTKGTNPICALTIGDSIKNFDLSSLTPGQWKYETFEVDTTALSETATDCFVEIIASDVTGDLYICDLKLEKGNKATDWTPAPEDSTRELTNATEDLRNAIPTDVVTHAELEVASNGISARVDKVETGEFGQVKVSGKNYLLGQDGFKIEDVNAEDPITTTITNNGMTVYKRDSETKQDPVLTANAEGVNAKDLHARTYLIVAGKTRFEKYKGTRIGCFWIGD